MAPLLEAISIGKTYPGGTRANDGVELSVAPGEVHAVVGENGAGKSTLMKILFGIEQPDSGELRLEGRPVSFANPREAIDHGIGMVFQHFSLVPSFSVYENVVLGSEPRKGIRFDREKAIAEVRALSEKFRLAVDPLPPVGELPVGQQQRVEILKALYRDARILILDEPTAVLAPRKWKSCSSPSVRWWRRGAPSSSSPTSCPKCWRFPTASPSCAPAAPSARSRPAR